ncbi:alanine racemase [Streptomyces sp. NPDC057654]|uniref:alanine racemase n=1 Tax=Streptomyces sp. NPDC057654 TaxID=3346196 RepID=UPI0036BFE901
MTALNTAATLDRDIEEHRQPVLRIDLAAVASNTRRLRAHCPRSAFMAVVKADAFGHGMSDVARTVQAHGADRLGVAALGEAHALRRAGLSGPVLAWLTTPHSDFEAALQDDIEVAVPGLEHLRAVAVAAFSTGRTAHVHLHADVGMARDGAPPEQWEELCGAARRLEAARVLRVVGVMGHLGCADHRDDPHNRQGRKAFTAAVRQAHRAGLRPRHRHLAATAALLNDPLSHYDLVRVGAGLYGIDPTRRAGLRQAMTLTAPVAAVRDVAAGTPVGYGHAFHTDRPTRLALLPLGYGDGLPRQASHQAQVLLRGRRRNVVGLFSMDQIVIDAGDDPVAPGETVTVLGPGDTGEPTVEDWARWAGTLPHHLLTTLGAQPRPARRTLPAPPPSPSASRHPADLEIPR